MTRGKWIIFGTALIAFVMVFWAVAARHETPTGQPRLDRLSDKRAIQWWDKEHVIAGLLKTSTGDKDLGCCKRNETLWDVIAVYPPGVRWTDRLPVPTFFAGPVVRGAPKWEAQLKQHS